MSDHGRTCRVRRQSSPDVSVPLNLTLKHSSATSPLHLASSSLSTRSAERHHEQRHRQHQHQQRDVAAYSSDTSQRRTAALTATLADEVHH